MTQAEIHSDYVIHAAAYWTAFDRQMPRHLRMRDDNLRSEHCGEVWQFMGASMHPDHVCWRHRCHPLSEQREYVHVHLSRVQEAA